MAKIMTDEEEMIEKLSRAGERFSRQCRHVFTGEQISTTVRSDDFCGCITDMIAICSMTNLASYCRLNDVFYMGTATDQHKWDAKKWALEIGKQIKNKKYF